MQVQKGTSTYGRDIQNGSLIEIAKPAVRTTNSGRVMGGLFSCLQEPETNVEKQEQAAAWEEERGGY